MGPVSQSGTYFITLPKMLFNDKHSSFWDPFISYADDEVLLKKSQALSLAPKHQNETRTDWQRQAYQSTIVSLENKVQADYLDRQYESVIVCDKEVKKYKPQN